MTLNWPLLALAPMMLIVGVSCGETERETAQGLTAASPGPGPNAQIPVVPPPTPVPKTTIPDPSCPKVEALKAQLADLQRDFTDWHPRIVMLKETIEVLQEQCSAGPSKKQPSGKWQVQNGVLVCDGYVVRNIDKDYCAKEVPDSWVPRTFNGNEYYVQPLDGPERILAGS